MTICNPKIHIICGACGCNSMLEYSITEPDISIHCRNCSFVVGIDEVLPLCVSDQTKTKDQKNRSNICPACLGVGKWHHPSIGFKNKPCPICKNNEVYK